jgi:hypothetical protein
MLVALCGTLAPYPAEAAPTIGSAPLPRLTDFILTVKSGNDTELRGAYAEGLFAFPVDQQPLNSIDYVTGKDQRLTQFELASEYGNVGLLAHNFLSGRFFGRLSVGQRIALVFGGGRLEWYRVARVLRYRAVNPLESTSDFIDINDNELRTAGELFQSVYTGDRHVTFQTCIERDGTASWGRLFVIAEPEGLPYKSSVST